MLSEDLPPSVLIGCNGGMTWKNGRVVLSHTLTPDFVTRVLKVMTDLGISYVLDGEWNYSVSAKLHPYPGIYSLAEQP